MLVVSEPEKGLGNLLYPFYWLKAIAKLVTSLLRTCWTELGLNWILLFTAGTGTGANEPKLAEKQDDECFYSTLFEWDYLF